MNFRYRFMQFMSGRYGADKLTYALLGMACVMAVLNIVFRVWLIEALVTVILAFALFRYLSKNIYARREENRKFNECINKIIRKSEIQRKRRADIYHVYRKCPQCKAILRLPRRKGKHKTVCPKCNREFTVRVRKENV